MKALIICPADRPNVSHLAEATPLSTIHVCGKPLIYYWLESLVEKGAKEILVLAVDRPNEVRRMVGDGSRWGISVQIIPERHEFTLAEAKLKYAVEHIVLADCLPQFPNLEIFSSYTDFFSTVQKFSPACASADRIGLREIQPGVWCGLHTQISSSAQLVAPCWIGDQVCIGTNTVIGPNAIIENRSLIENGASIQNSIVQPETLIGAGINLTNSIAAGNTLINHKYGSATHVSDPFLLSSLHAPKSRAATNIIGRFAALLTMILTGPLAFLWTLISHWRGQTVIRQLQAVNPLSVSSANETISYYEFANCDGLFQRWPQLWNIVRGEFAWVGNRPLGRIEADQLNNDFEKLWLQSPVGLVAQADAAGCFEKFSDEARVHASFYAAHRSLRLDLSILWQVIKGCSDRVTSMPVQPTLAPGKIELGKRVVR